MPKPEAAIRDGLFLEYRVEGSTSPGRTRAAHERITFPERAGSSTVMRSFRPAVPTSSYRPRPGDPYDAGDRSR